MHINLSYTPFLPIVVFFLPAFLPSCLPSFLYSFLSTADTDRAKCKDAFGKETGVFSASAANAKVSSPFLPPFLRFLPLHSFLPSCLPAYAAFSLTAVFPSFFSFLSSLHYFPAFEHVLF